MSNLVNIYTISFEKNGEVINWPIMEFFEKIEENLIEDESRIIKTINGEVIRCFSYFYNQDRTKVVIPFGKVKTRNKPFWLNTEKKLEEIPRDIFDINSLAYDKNEKIMLFTTNNMGVKVEYVKDYLNSFIPQEREIKIEIKPIIINKGIQKVRNARFVRSITINLDLGKSLNNFYIEEMENNEDQNPLIKSLKSLIGITKENGDSKTFSLSFGVGHSGKNGTLDLDSTLSVLESINIDEEFVKEIFVSYKGGLDEKIDVTKLKNSSVILSYPFSISGALVPSEYMINNFASVISDKRREYSRQHRRYFRTARDIQFEGFNFLKFIE